MPFRSDQLAIIEEATALLRAGKNTLVVSPTGSGKGDIIVHFLALAASALFLVHSSELVLDTAGRLAARGVPCRMLLGSQPEGPADARVTVASWDTMSARRLTLPVSLIVIDEAHRSAARTYREVTKRHPGVPLLGFTATGSRGDGRGLRSAGYDELVSGPQIDELVQAGALAPMAVYSPATSTEGLAEEPVVAWQRFSRGLPGVVFCASVEASRETAAAFCRAGYRAAHLDGDTPWAERRRIMSDFQAGAIDIVCNKRLICDGVNVPRAKVVMLASRFSHPGPYLQALGRARRATGEEAVAIDLYGNVHEHGFPDEPRYYALDADAVRRDGEAPVAAVQCFHCLRWGTGGQCACGARLPPPPPPRLTKAELKALKQAAATKTGPQWQLWVRLCREQRDRKLRPQYAPLAFRGMTGRFPRWTVKQGLEG